MLRSHHYDSLEADDSFGASRTVMSEQPVMRKQTPRWQDVRAKAIDATFDADRRRAGERVALVFRWLFLIVIGALNNLNPSSTPEEKVVIDVVLFGWAVLNVTVQVLLVRGYRPGKQFSLTTMVLDIFFRSEEHTSELQSRRDLVCRLLLEKKK